MLYANGLLSKTIQQDVLASHTCASTDEVLWVYCRGLAALHANQVVHRDIKVGAVLPQLMQLRPGAASSTAPAPTMGASPLCFTLLHCSGPFCMLRA